MKKYSSYKVLVENPLDSLASKGRTRIETEQGTHKIDPNDIQRSEGGWCLNSTSWSEAKGAIEKRHPGLSKGIEIVVGLAPAVTDFDAGFLWHGKPQVPQNPLIIDVTVQSPSLKDYVRVHTKSSSINLFDGNTNTTKVFRGKNCVGRAVSALYDLIATP